MKGILETAITSPVRTAPKGIVYGPPGVGKTTFGASAGNVLLIDCEHGAGHVECARTPYLDKWADISQWLVAVRDDDHDYTAIAIDSLDWLIRRIEEYVSGADTGRVSETLNRSHGGYGNGKQVMRNCIYQTLLPMLDRIVDRGVAVIMLAHAKRQDITDVDGATVEKTTPEVPEDYLGVFVEWADFVCLARSNAEGVRSLYTVETARALAKNRYGMPPVLPFTWADFVSAVSGNNPERMSE